MSKESYIRGFCKAAEAAGVDPQALAKYATGATGATPASQPLVFNTTGPKRGRYTTPSYYWKQVADELKRFGDDYAKRAPVQIKRPPVQDKTPVVATAN